MCTHPKQPRRPIKPYLVALGLGNSAALNRLVKTKSRRMPIVRGPVHKSEKQESDRYEAVLPHEAQAEFAPLIVQEQQPAGDDDKGDRAPHRRKGAQEVPGERNRPQYSSAQGEGDEP